MLLRRILLRTTRAAALAGILACGASPAWAAGYPHMGYYGSMYGDGYPLWDSTGTLNSTVLDEIARFQDVVLDASPITPYRPDAIAALRQRNPKIELFAYVTGHYIWDANDPDSLVHYPTRHNHMVRRLDGFLYNKQGEKFGELSGTFGNVNLAKRDSQGRYVVADSLAWLFWDAIARTGLWDGIFIDTYCNSILWMESPAESIDYVRAGYPTRDAFAAAFKAGTDTLAARLRAYVGPNFLLVGNCGDGTKYAWFNGWMRENFPFQQGGDWYTNMYRDPGGYFVDEARHLAPTHNWIFSADVGYDQPYSATNIRKMRFGLGSAALGSGMAAFGPATRQSRPYTYQGWWYDEYAVDLTTGTASGRVEDTGWLGQALGPYDQMVWVGTNPDAVTNPDFETDVDTGWTLGVFGGAVASRSQDVTTAGSGSASLRVNVAVPASVNWYVNVASTGTIPVSTGQTYSATFWAKASSPRAITLAAGRTSGGDYGTRTLTIDTTWKRYQAAIVATGTGNARLQVFLGLDAGDVWLDDVHFQAGVTSLYRRDFQNGIVLVNPSTQNLTVPLEREYRTISGLVDPVANDGRIVTQITVPAQDARFLIGDDQIPPSDVTDLRPSVQ